MCCTRVYTLIRTVLRNVNSRQTKASKPEHSANSREFFPLLFSPFSKLIKRNCLMFWHSRIFPWSKFIVEICLLSCNIGCCWPELGRARWVQSSCSASFISAHISARDDCGCCCCCKCCCCWPQIAFACIGIWTRTGELSSNSIFEAQISQRLFAAASRRDETRRGETRAYWPT